MGRSIKKRSQRHPQTTLISNILTKSESSVGIYTGSNLNSIKLFNKTICKRIESFRVIFCPPVIKITIFVKLTTAVVKTMSCLMTDYDTDGTIILGIVSIRIKVRRLKYGSRETYLDRKSVV